MISETLIIETERGWRLIVSEQAPAAVYVAVGNDHGAQAIILDRPADMLAAASKLITCAARAIAAQAEQLQNGRSNG